MITGVIRVERGAKTLALTLSSLVDGVVQGITGDAVVVVPEPDADVATVAEAAGASLVIAPAGADPWRAGAAVARGQWVLCLCDGDVPGQGWTRAVERFVIAAGGSRSLGRLTHRALPGPIRLIGVAEAWFGTTSLRAGDVARRDWLAGTARARVWPVPIRATVEREPGAA